MAPSRTSGAGAPPRRGDAKEAPQSSASSWAERREKLGVVLYHPLAEVFLSLVVIASLICLIIETDALAPEAHDQGPQEPSLELLLLNEIFVLMFVLEVGLKVWVKRWKFFTGSGILNFTVTSLDVLLGTIDIFWGSMPEVAVLRCMRLIRLLRLLRVVKWFPELGYLVAGLASAFITVMWGAIMVVIILLMFSLLAVEVLHPINLKVAARGDYGDCFRCYRAFSSTWDAFLTFTQTLIFGDSWGAVALPIIQEEWWAIGIFVGAFASIVLAVMNLILAAMVDHGARARDNTLKARTDAEAAAKAEGRRGSAERLLAICGDLDVEDSGRLTKQGLLEAHDWKEDFRREVEALGFSRQDLAVFLDALARDGEGRVDYAALFAAMRDASGAELHQTLAFVKLAVMDLWCRKEEEDGRISQRLEDLARAVEESVPLGQAPKNSPRQSNLSEPSSPRSGLLKVPPRPHSEERQQQGKAKGATASPRRASVPEAARQGPGKLQAEGAGQEAKRSAKKAPVEPKEPKGLTPELTTPSMVGSWHPLEAANQAGSLALPIAKEGALEPKVREEMVQILRKIAQETERTSKILCNMDKTVSGHVGNAIGLRLPAGRDEHPSAEGSGAAVAFWAGPPAAPPPPPSVRCTELFPRGREVL